MLLFFAVYSSAGLLVTNLKVFHSQDFEKKKLKLCFKNYFVNTTSVG